MERLRQYATNNMRKFRGTIADSDMRHFLTAPQGLEAGLRMMIMGAAEYLSAHKQDFGPIAESDYLLTETFDTLLRELRKLLNFSGRFDGATLDRYICDLAAEHGLDIE